MRQNAVACKCVEAEHLCASRCYEMRARKWKRCQKCGRPLLRPAPFAKDLDRDVGPDSDEVLGPDKGAPAHAWFRRFWSLKEYLVPLAACRTGLDRTACST